MKRSPSFQLNEFPLIILGDEPPNEEDTDEWNEIILPPKLNFNPDTVRYKATKPKPNEWKLVKNPDKIIIVAYHYLSKMPHRFHFRVHHSDATIPMAIYELDLFEEDDKTISKEAAWLWKRGIYSSQEDTKTHIECEKKSIENAQILDLMVRLMSSADQDSKKFIQS
jgi:hypothetical protein